MHTTASMISGYVTATVVVALVGRIFVCGVFAVLYVHTPEMFPTEVRNVAIGSASTAGRTAGLIAAFVGGPLVSAKRPYLKVCLLSVH